ncbi:MAG: hypothetical protein R3Y64_06500 [Peptostreptococcaceae bacterium]
MKYVESSFIPSKKISLALIDKRVSKEILDKLNKLNIKVIKSTKNNTYDAINYHPDISILKLDYQNIIVCPNLYDYYKNALKLYNFNIIKGNKNIEEKYPKNIYYNICIFGKFAVHNFKYTDQNIIDYLDKNNFIKINVKQGYCKCMICVVDSNSIITSDIKIHKEVKKYGIDSLLIDNGSIDLFELNYGFIGGCSGLISNDTICFFGDIKKHKNYVEIEKFISSKNKKIVSLSSNNLIDYGSLLPLMY